MFLSPEIDKVIPLYHPPRIYCPSPRYSHRKPVLYPLGKLSFTSCVFRELMIIIESFDFKASN